MTVHAAGQRVVQQLAAIPQVRAGSLSRFRCHVTDGDNRTYVNETFAKCTDSNRAVVEAELKGMILKAFQSNTLWDTDWSKTQLESLNLKKRKCVISKPAEPNPLRTIL